MIVCKHNLFICSVSSIKMCIIIREIFRGSLFSRVVRRQYRPRSAIHADCTSLASSSLSSILLPTVNILLYRQMGGKSTIFRLPVCGERGTACSWDTTADNRPYPTIVVATNQYAGVQLTITLKSVTARTRLDAGAGLENRNGKLELRDVVGESC